MNTSFFLFFFFEYISLKAVSPAPVAGGKAKQAEGTEHAKAWRRGNGSPAWEAVEGAELSVGRAGGGGEQES